MKALKLKIKTSFYSLLGVSKSMNHSYRCNSLHLLIKLSTPFWEFLSSSTLFASSSITLVTFYSLLGVSSISPCNSSIIFIIFFFLLPFGSFMFLAKLLVHCFLVLSFYSLLGVSKSFSPSHTFSGFSLSTPFYSLLGVSGLCAI